MSQSSKRGNLGGETDWVSVNRLRPLDYNRQKAKGKSGGGLQTSSRTVGGKKGVLADTNLATTLAVSTNGTSSICSNQKHFATEK